MNHNRLKYIFIIISHLFILKTNAALFIDNNANPQCLVDVPSYEYNHINSSDIEIFSNKAFTNLNENAEFDGDVAVNLQNKTINAKKLTLEQKENRKLILTGNVVYTDKTIKLKGDSADINVDTKNTKINNINFHLIDRLGRGDAKKADYNDQRYIELDNASFTFCPVDNNSWRIEGSKITYDNKKEIIFIKNAVFKVGEVPIFYSPFFMFPANNKRTTGFLSPIFNTDTLNGIDVSFPFYLNITKNYDATITPRIITNRGLQLKSEFRYLNFLGEGLFAYEWLGNDNHYQNDKERWLFHWDHNINFNKNLNFKTNVTKVSDNNYVADLNSIYANETDGYLFQTYQVNYDDNYWNIKLNYEDIQVLSENNKELFYIHPQLEVNYVNSDFYKFVFYNKAQITHFVNSINKDNNAWRFHFEPIIEYNLTTPWLSIVTKAGFINNYYLQKLKKNENNFASSIFVPNYSVDSQLIFESENKLFGEYKLLLMPRLKYIYSPFHDQSKILNYDSSLVQNDTIGIFRDNIYSGLDRRSSMNKFIAGLTFKTLDSNNIEKSNFSFGISHENKPSKIMINKENVDSKKKVNWALDYDFFINNKLNFKSNVQYNNYFDEIILSNVVIEYKHAYNKFLQLSYRFASKNYIDNIFNNLTNENISLLGVVSAHPITDNINLFNSIYYDINTETLTENNIGLEFNNCCWNFFLKFNHRKKGYNLTKRKSTYVTKFSFGINLTGFTNNKSFPKALESRNLPYQTSF